MMMFSSASSSSFRWNCFAAPLLVALVVVISCSSRETQAFMPRTHTILSSPQQQQQQNNQQQQRKSPATPLRMSDDDGWAPSKSAMIGGAGVNNAGEPPFEIRGFSLGNLVIGAGLLITAASFAEYLGQDEGSMSGLGFVYGIPIFLAGAALKYAEIEPVPVRTTPKAEAVFEAKATETIRKIKQDVTRHRYGDEAHLDTTVKKLGLVVPGKAYPQLQELRQDVAENGVDLVFTMVWQSVDTPYKMWADERRVQKYETFFGPGIRASVVKVDAEQRLVGIQLTTTTAAPVTAEAVNNSNASSSASSSSSPQPSQQA